MFWLACCRNSFTHACARLNVSGDVISYTTIAAWAPLKERKFKNPCHLLFRYVDETQDLNIRLKSEQYAPTKKLTIEFEN